MGTMTVRAKSIRRDDKFGAVAMEVMRKPPDDFPSHEPADCFPAGGGRRLFADHPTAKQNQDAISDRNQLIELARNQEHADAAVSRLSYSLVDRGDGANVQPPRRLRCEKKDQRRDRQFARENRLLLIAAGEARHSRLGTRAANVIALHQRFGSLHHRGALKEAKPGEPPKAAEKKASAMVIARMQPTACRSSGTIPTPAAVIVAGFAPVISVSLTKILPDEGDSQSGQEVAELALTIALHAGKPDDLAGANLDGDRVKTPDSLIVVKADRVNRQRVWCGAAIWQSFRAPISDEAAASIPTDAASVLSSVPISR